MAAIDFPASPTDNQLFTPATGVTYRYVAVPGLWAVEAGGSGYLLLSGGTLTGHLAGTTAAFSGIVTAPTAAVATNTTQVATTAFVQAQITTDLTVPTNAIAYGDPGAVGVTGVLADLAWDPTNKRLGIGTSAPAVMLDVRGAATLTGALIGTTGTFSGIVIATATSGAIQARGTGATQTSMFLYQAGMPADQKTWEFLTSSTAGTFALRTINDAYTLVGNVFTVTRGSGYAVAGMTIVPPLTLSSNLIATTATFSGIIQPRSNVEIGNAAYLYTHYNGATPNPGIVRAGFQFDGTNQGISVYTANTYRGGWDAGGLFSWQAGATFGGDVRVHAAYAKFVWKATTNAADLKTWQSFAGPPEGDLIIGALNDAENAMPAYWRFARNGAMTVPGGLTIGGTLTTSEDTSSYALFAGRWSAAYGRVAMNTRGNYGWSFQVNGSDALWIDGNGYVKTNDTFTAGGIGASATWGQVKLTTGGAGNTGYVSFWNPAGARTGYIGFGTGGSINYILDAGGVHSFQGGQVQVVGNLSAYNYLPSGNTVNDASTYGFTNANGPSMVTWGNSTGGAGQLQFSTAGAVRMSINTAGNVGINCAPAYRLDMFADIDGLMNGLRFENSSTGVNSASLFTQAAGGRYVVRYVNRSGLYLHEQQGGGLVTRYSDFDTHHFRTGAGTTSLVLTSDLRAEFKGPVSANVTPFGNVALAAKGIAGQWALYVIGSDGNFRLGCPDGSSPQAMTPALTSNSTEVATTAWVRQRARSLYSETTASGSGVLDVTIPANAKGIELEFAFHVLENVNQVLYLQAKVGGAAVGTGSYNWQYDLGTVTTPQSNGANAGGYFNLGSSIYWVGTIHLMNVANVVGMWGHGYGIGSGGRYVIKWGGDAGITWSTVDGFRVGILAGTIAAPCYLRCYVMT